MMLAVMTVAAKVEVAAAAGMLATILVLLVASSPFTCILKQIQPTLSRNSSFLKPKTRQKNSLLGNHLLKSVLVFTKMFRIIINTLRSNFSKMHNHRKAHTKKKQIRVFEKSPFTKKHKKTRKCKFAFMKSYLFTKTLIAQKPLIRERSNHRQKFQNGFLHVEL